MADRIYLFDFDGTLVDSMPAYGQMMIRILKDLGLPCEEDILRIVTPMSALGKAEYLVSHGAALSIEGVLDMMRRCILDAYVHTIPAKAHVPAALEELHRRGDHLNILTASPHCTLDPCLKRLGLWDYFDRVWSCDDFGLAKDQPEIYHQAARLLGAKEGDILFLDDHLVSLSTAKAAGMQVCGVYDDSSRDFEAQIRSLAHFYIRDFSQLNDISW